MVSVPLRGNGMKASIYHLLNHIFLALVSVPLRGNGMKEEVSQFEPIELENPRFRPLAG